MATTNVPMQLDDAALSRFAVLPVLFASAAELVQIMTIHTRRLDIALESDLASLMNGYTMAGGVLSGRSAVQLLEAAHVHALRASNPVVTVQHVCHASKAGSAATGRRPPNTPRCHLCSAPGTQTPGPGSWRADSANATNCPPTCSPTAPQPERSTSARYATASPSLTLIMPSGAMADPPTSHRQPLRISQQDSAIGNWSCYCYRIGYYVGDVLYA